MKAGAWALAFSRFHISYLTTFERLVEIHISTFPRIPVGLFSLCLLARHRMPVFFVLFLPFQGNLIARFRRYTAIP